MMLRNTCSSFGKLKLAFFLLHLCFILSHQSEMNGYLGSPCSQRENCGFLPGLACIENSCSNCYEDADCNDHRSHTKMKCLISSTNKTHESKEMNLCVEKDLFEPFTANDGLTTVLVYITAALGSGGGIGGGGILVPLYVLVMQLGPKHAIPLSKATIFGVSIAQFLFNFNQRHPYMKHRPLIDYKLSMIMEPTTLCGTIAGVLLNHWLPSWIILFLLIILLGITSCRTLHKGYKLHIEEKERDRRLKCCVQIGNKITVASIALHWRDVTRKRQIARRILAEDVQDFKSLPPLKDNNLEQIQLEGCGSKLDCDQEKKKELLRYNIINEESKTFPMDSILLLCLAWVIVFISALLRGGHGSPSVANISCGSSPYWIAVFTTIPLLYLITWRGSKSLRLLNRLKVLSEYPFVEGDIHWTKKKVRKYPLLCVLAGVAAGMLGVGGGMVKGPMMLEMGIIPQVQSATAAFMILFTSSSTTVQFAIAGQFPGKLQYDYVLWYAFIGFLGGLSGQLVIAYALKRYNKTSIIVILLGFMISLSVLLMGYIGSVNVWKDIQNHHNLGFSSIC